MAAAGAIIAVLFCYQFMLRFPIWTLRAFKISSDSMCPTVCRGERAFVEMQYGRPYVPKRDEVIVLDYGTEHALFIKRVLGLAGDVIANGPGDTILVNGQAWQPAAVCGKSLSSADDSSPVSFPETKVPQGQIFVIGDNLNHSLDSRIGQFQPVTLSQVVGKARMIYWSPESARIGCPIK
jgi:signal peptidase I